MSKMLHQGDEIILDKDLSVTGSLSGLTTSIFYLGSANASFIVLSGATAGVTCQATNLSPSNTAFEGSFTAIGGVTIGTIFELIDKPYRFIRFRHATDISTLKYQVFSTLCSNHVT